MCPVAACRVRIRNRGGEGDITLDYLNGLHSKHEDWLMEGMPAQTWLTKHHFNSSSSSSGLVGVNGFGSYPFSSGNGTSSSSSGGSYSSFGNGNGHNSSSSLWGLPSSSSSSGVSLGYGSSSGNGNGLLLPPGQGSGLLVPGSIDHDLYVLQHNAVMHEALEGVPALVLDCSQDVLRNQDLREEFQRKVMDYIRFMRDFRLARATLRGSSSDGDGSSGFSIGSSSSSSSGSNGVTGRKEVSASPGAPSPEQQERLEIVQQAAKEGFGELVKAVPTSPGDVVVGVNGHGEGAAVGVSGGLEALMAAEVIKNQQQQQQGVAVMRG